MSRSTIVIKSLPVLAVVAVFAAAIISLTSSLSGLAVADEPEAKPAVAPAKAYVSGLYPLRDNAEVPIEWMPPGSRESPIPSDEIFPPQVLTIRFNHKKHVEEMKLGCKVCHDKAYTSANSSDRLLPSPANTCDNCHDVNHSDLSKVVAGTDESGQCNYCHLGDNAGRNGRVARLVMPSPNLRFPHKDHLDRNIACGQCHGQVEKLELATRDQLPRMAGCFNCHAMPTPSQGEAKGTCINCHITEPTSAVLETSFATGQLFPPDWLHQAGHTPDWIERHKTIAANDSKFCASCHTEEDCASCHDGRVRNRKVHPNDWISMHAQSARMDNPRCVSCHQEQTFCADCHRRVGVARDAPAGNRGVSERFHLPSNVWTSAPRGPQHHAWEAQQNLNACVACHAERDCASCHASRGLPGGQGVSPHAAGFASSAACESALDRNPRACLVCHESRQLTGKCR